jgi:AAA family ATP:ADP antiporter
MFFAVLGGYFMMRPVRDALGLARDPAFVPWLFTGTCVAMLAVAPIWGALVSRWPRRVFVPVVYRFFALNLLIFIALIHADIAPTPVRQVFYVWSSVYNFFVVSVFWSLLTDIFTREQARRLFGPIALGGTLGAIAGPLVTRALVERVDTAGILLGSFALIEVAVYCSRRLDAAAGAARREPSATDAPPSDAEPVRGHALAGLVHVVRSPYLGGVVLYVLCVSFAATFIYLEQAQIVHDHIAGEAARTAYFATVDAWTNITTAAVQLLLTGRLIRWLGAGAVLAALPLVQGLGLAALVAAPGLTLLLVVQVAGRSTTHALARPCREMLFTVVSRDDKYKAKNVIDTFVYRFGDFAAAWLRTGLVAIGLAGAGLFAFAGPLTAIWLAAAVMLGVAFHRRAAPAPRSSP